MAIFSIINLFADNLTVLSTFWKIWRTNFRDAYYWQFFIVTGLIALNFKLLVSTVYAKEIMHKITFFFIKTPGHLDFYLRILGFLSPNTNFFLPPDLDNINQSWSAGVVQKLKIKVSIWFGKFNWSNEKKGLYLICP